MFDWNPQLVVHNLSVLLDGDLTMATHVNSLYTVGPASVSCVSYGLYYDEIYQSALQ